MATSIPSRHTTRLEKVPTELRKSVDAAELIARLDEAERLENEARRTTQPGAAADYLSKSVAVLKAIPRPELDRAVRDLHQKAANAKDATLRLGYLQRVRDLVEANPQPSTEQVESARKFVAATAAPVRPAPPRRWTGTTPKAAPSTASGPDGDMLYKSVGDAVLSGLNLAELQAKAARLRAAADAAEAAARTAGRAIATPSAAAAASGTSAAKSVNTTAASLRAKAAATPDPALRRGYLERAAELDRS